MLPPSNVGTPGRGFLRGFFVLVLALWLCCSCDRKGPDVTPDASTEENSEPGATTGSVVDAGESADVGAAANTPAPIEAPWTRRPEALSALEEEVAGRDIGRLSGEIFGQDRVVRHVVRAQCGAGSVLQVIYDEDGALRVTPGMAVRFFGLQTGQPVTYTEGDFEITVDFDHDTPDRLAGHLRITYREDGVERVYADLNVDGRPSTMLRAPNLRGKGRMPLFEQCFPNGYFRAVEADGTEHRGLLHVTDVKERGAPLATLLFGVGTGVRVFVVPPRPNRPFETDNALELAEARAPGTRPAAVLASAFHVPELTEPSDARAGNIAEEQSVHIHSGTAEFALRREGGTWHFTMAARDVEIPVLLDGPLHGKTFAVIEIDAYPTPPGEVPELSDAAPDWWTDDED